MKPLKLNSFHKFVCFVMIVILVISVVGLAVDGWQSEQPKQPDSGDVGENTDNTDENKDGPSSADDKETTDNKDNEATEAPKDDEGSGVDTPPPVIYTNPLTGLEISENEYNSLPIGVVVNPSAPLYGVSSTNLAIEFPIEDGSTRLLTYLSGEKILWKIGSLSASRKFISGMTDFFGGIVVSYGKDDKVTYNAWEAKDLTLDLMLYSDAYYAENTLYIYTSESMIDTALNRNQEIILNAADQKPSAPYRFTEGEPTIGTSSAATLIIPYSQSNETELYYHEKSGKYIYYKSGVRKMDMLTGENTAFSNVFILFADATTYEKADGTELVIDTHSGGKGYYASAGTITEFKWSTDKGGSLEFKTLSGEPLTVNRGNAYIAYYKSSNSSAVKFY